MQSRWLRQWIMASGTTLLTAGAAQAVTLSHAPLFLTQSVKPNIILSIDDSGSMDGELLLPTNDGAAWWNSDDQSFIGRNRNDNAAPGVLNFNSAGGATDDWKKFVYLFPIGGSTGANTGRRVYADATHDHYAIPPLPQFAWARSPTYNAAYFDPGVSYPPWRNADGSSFPDADPDAAPTDPHFTGVTFNLTAPVRDGDSSQGAAPSGGTGNDVFKLYAGTVVPAGTVLDTNTSKGSVNWATLGSDVTLTGERNLAIEYFPATFYLPTGTAPPAGFGYTATPATGGLAPDGSALDRYEIRPANFASTAAYDAALQNFANWFTYYRKRHLATKAGIAESFVDLQSLRVGRFFINNRVDVTMRDLGVASAKSALYTDIFSQIGSGGTPNREAMDHCGRQFMRSNSGAPIQYPCQQNFAILFTDGYSNASSVSGIGNEDGSAGAPYADNVTGTIADIAMKYFKSNLRPGFATGRVAVPAGCNTPAPAPNLDCNKNLHMVTFGVTLGQDGVIFDANNPPDPYANAPIWPTTFPARHPSAIDDLWHATINGRGEFLNAKTPRDVADKLLKVLRNIAGRTSSASSVATNSTRLTADTAIYQARFSSTDWSGQLIALPIQSDGSIGSPLWDAASLIPNPTLRNLYTYDPQLAAGARGREFQFNQLNAAQVAALNTNPDTGVPDALGAARLQYLRGDDSNEAPNGLDFRARSTRLGDIVNSDPVFMGRQDFGFDKLPGGEGTSYTSFRSSTAYQTRNRLVIVGANDGMLHGFDADSGAELFGYVPNAVYGKLAALTDTDYNQAHSYLVDGSGRAVDAYVAVGGSAQQWETIYMGSLGLGGKGVFALRVTDPASFDEQDVLWEFTNANDSDMGAAVPQPSIARMANGKWAAIVANGPNSGSQRAVLFVLDLETGGVIKELDTGVGGDNGLSSPIPVDVNSDRIADFIYAGDLKGNMWKFDVSNSNPNQWQIAFKSGSTPLPLYRACTADPCSSGTAQPITARPEVGINPLGGVIVLFGTGRYFADGDNSTAIATQSFYGIHDRYDLASPAPVAGRNNLLRQEVLATTTLTVDGFTEQVRVTSNNQPGASHKGWYIDLPSAGERQVSTPILRGGRIIFTTLIPSTDPCSFGGSSWLMELDALSGARLGYSPFDINRDHLFNSTDYATVVVNGETITVPVSGRLSSEGIIKTPGIIVGGELEFKYASGTTGGIDQVIENAAGSGGRQSWRQIQ